MQYMMEGEERSTRENDEAAGIITVTRIFVGGLGGSVTADDIRKTFSFLGKVKDVDIVRTKGRSFAYMNFCPSSDNALSKLFSMYNGCVWKGGKLRLERAKEHYIVRLRREWEEDAQIASTTSSNDMDVDKKIVSLEKSKKFQKTEKEEIRIFFPRLRKVKSLALRGTGKHKYSFQRTEVPALPLHFCDCEEHSDLSHAVTGKNFSDLERQNGGMNEEEVDLMNSVMNKLFNKENNLKAASDRTVWVKEVDSSIESFNDFLLDENEACHVAEDNLIINMVAGGSDRMGFMSPKRGTFSIKQESRSAELQTSEDRRIKNVHSIQERKIGPPNKKRKSLPNEVSNENRIVSPIPEKKGRLQSAEQKSGMRQSATSLSWSRKSSWRELVDSSETSQFSISQMLQRSTSTADKEQELGSVDVPNATDCKIQSALRHETLDEGQQKEMVELADAQSTNPTGVLNKSASGSSWQQKSSWTQLVGDLNSSSFSIAEIVTDANLEKEDLAKPNGADVIGSMGKKHCDLGLNNSEPAGDCFKGFRSEKDGSIAVHRSSEMVNLDKKEQSFLNGAQSALKKIQHTIMDSSNEVSAPKVTMNHVAAATQASPVNGGMGETWFFMKSDASMKEWASVKAALCGSLKKKRNDK